MISATDPVTTLAIFKEQRLAERRLGHLYYSVLGESVLNDAVGITLFSSFSQQVLQHKTSLGAADVAEICAEFAWTFLGSMVVGGLMGLAMPLVLKLARLEARAGLVTLSDGHYGTDFAQDNGEESEEELQFNVPEIGVALVLAMSPYLMAEAFDLSGIVAIMFSGMTAKW